MVFGASNSSCDAPAFRRLWSAVSVSLGLAAPSGDGDGMAVLRWTAWAEGDKCPVAVAVGKLTHSLVTFHRDWHGDMGKVKARPIHMLQIPLKHELQLILQPELILPESQSALQWHLLLYHALAQLSSLLCSEGSVLDYKLYCQERPWTLGCISSPPSCNDTAQWRKSPAELLNCAERETTTSSVLRCLGRGMPENPSRLLDLVVPLQSSWWHAMADLLRDRTFHRSDKVGVHISAPCNKAIATEYLPVALCSGQKMAPKHGHIVRSEVLENRLEAVVFATTAQKLQGCGIELEIHLHVNEVGEIATRFLGPCIGIACREQCASWEGTHYLRFSIVACGFSPITCATASGHATEPSLHTLITCRLPWQIVPKWMGGYRADQDVLQVELKEMDGVFSKSISLEICPFERPKERHILGCLKPSMGVGQFSQLLDDWLRYHRLMGVDHFMLYDVDGSIEPLLSTGVLSSLLQHGRLTYVPHFSRNMGARMEALTVELWHKGLANQCIQPRSVNHCLALSRSAGFEWFVYLRGMDKFLHSDVDPSSGMLRRFLDALPSQMPSFQILRRHCGATDVEAMRVAAQLSAEVELPVPVFSQFQRCEALQLSVDDPMRDDSWVPAMRPSLVDFAMTNMAISFNRSTDFFAAVPVRILRAQHFVRAFEGKEVGPRLYAPDMKDANRFTELDTMMDWATAALRQKDVVFEADSLMLLETSWMFKICCAYWYLHILLRLGERKILRVFLPWKFSKRGAKILYYESLVGCVQLKPAAMLQLDSIQHVDSNKKSPQATDPYPD